MGQPIKLSIVASFINIHITILTGIDKVQMYKEIMTNDDSLESNLLTSSLLKMCYLVQAELCVFTAQWQEMN